MNVYSKRYGRIVRDLIKKSFPELKGKKVFVYDVPFLKGGALAIYLLFIRIILFGKRSRDYNGDGLKSLIVHELSHILDFSRMSVFEYFYRGIILFFNEKNVIRTEQFADKEAVRRGYAKGLYSNRLVWWKKLTSENPRILNRYLSPLQIKKYAQKIGKW